MFNINQLLLQVIVCFVLFSIGVDVVVNVVQLSLFVVLLVKVIGVDILQIYGKFLVNGMVVLYNFNGVVIGFGGMVDVVCFIVIFLVISDNDFLVGCFNFIKDGNVGLVDNQGKISLVIGGSVYLIGGSVFNSGIIISLQGEVIFVVGQIVMLVDIVILGVIVNVIGSVGNVINFGIIIVEVGCIGVVVGFIMNGGVINVFSVVCEGGCIFLCVLGNLIIMVSFSISVDGIKGGNVMLYVVNVVFIDGDVLVVGVLGQGGFVDIFGLKWLDVVKVLKVGMGGIWFIDLYDLEVVFNIIMNVSFDGCLFYVVIFIDSGVMILVVIIFNQLSNGVSVSLIIGDSDGVGGNIIVFVNIIKSGGVDSILMFNFVNNISIWVNIISESGWFGLIFNSGYVQLL